MENIIFYDIINIKCKYVGVYIDYKLFSDNEHIFDHLSILLPFPLHRPT